MLKKLLPLLFVAIISLSVSSTIVGQIGKFSSRDYSKRYSAMKQVYLDSQYVNKHPKNIIPDETVYGYAAGFMLKGGSPVLVNAEHPPLGKYFISLSILIFNNEHFVIIPFAILSLFTIFLVGRQIFQSTTLALAPPLIFSLEPIFKNQLIYTPLLDIMQLPFLYLFFYFFNKSSSKKTLIPLMLASVCLGLFISIKFYVTGITIVAAWFLVLMLRKDSRRIKYSLLVLPFSLLILFVSYSRLLFLGYSFKEIVGIQKYVLIYHKSQIGQPLSLWPLILFNKWHVWWGNRPVLSDPQWNFLWPIATLASIATSIAYIFKRISRNENIEIVIAWTFFYFLLNSIGQATTRYFIILLPALYIIAAYGLVQLVRKFYSDFPDIIKNK